MPPTSYPLLSGTGISDQLEVQSIYLSDCRAFRHPDHVCQVDICAHKHHHHHSHWEPIYRDPSGHHHHHHHPSTGLPSTATQSTSTSPASIGRDYRSPVSRHRQLDDDVQPEFEERGREAPGSLGSLPRAEVSRGVEGRYNDPGSQTIRRSAIEETSTFDLVKDYVRPISLPDDDDGQLHRRRHPNPEQFQSQSVLRRSTFGDEKLRLHPNDGGQLPDNCSCCPRRALDGVTGPSGPPPRGTLTRVRLSTTTTPSDTGNALSVT